MARRTLVISGPTDPRPYFRRGDEPGFEVGFYNCGYHDRRPYGHPVRACADFLYREAVWVLTRTKVC